MKLDSIVSESFDLTPAIKEEVDDRLNKIREYTSRETPFQVFISKTSDHTYSVRILGHLGRRDIEGSAESNDFHIALNHAKQNIVRQIVDNKEKTIGKRHNGKEMNKNLGEQ